jgi:RHS repeat-associated protein
MLFSFGMGRLRIALLVIACLLPAARAQRPVDISGDVDGISRAVRMDGVAGYVEGIGRDTLRDTFERGGGVLISSAFADAVSKENMGRMVAPDDIRRMHDDVALKERFKEAFLRRVEGVLPRTVDEVVGRRLFSGEMPRREYEALVGSVTDELDADMKGRLSIMADGVFERLMDADGALQNFGGGGAVTLSDYIGHAQAPHAADFASAGYAKALGAATVRGMQKEILKGLEGRLPPDVVAAIRSGRAGELSSGQEASIGLAGTVATIYDAAFGTPQIKIPTPAYATILAASAAGHYARAFRGLFVDPYELRRAIEVTSVLVWQVRNKENISISLVELAVLSYDIATQVIDMHCDGFVERFAAPIARIEKLAKDIEGQATGALDQAAEALARPAREIQDELLRLKGEMESYIASGVKGAAGAAGRSFQEDILRDVPLGLSGDVLPGEEIAALNPGVADELDPVYLGNGEFHVEATDFAIPGRGLHVAFTRIYRSRSNFLGELGWGWTHSYAERISENGKGLVHIDEFGRKFLFVEDSGKNFKAPPGVYERLSRPGDGYELTDIGGTVTSFDGRGRMTSKSDRYGNAMKFLYDAKSGLLSKVVDVFGRRVEIKRDARGLINSVCDFAGRCFGYEYDADKNLIRAKTPAVLGFPSGKNTSYGYDAGARAGSRGHLMTSITDPSGNRYLQNRYDGDGRVVWQGYGGREYDISYSCDGGLKNCIAVSERGGGVGVYEHDDDGHLLRKTVVQGDERRVESEFGYDGQGRVTRECDGASRCLEYEYDKADIPWPTAITRIADKGEGQRRIAIKREDPFGRATEVVAEDGVTTRFLYDEKRPHDLKTIMRISSDGKTKDIVERREYDAFGQLVSIVGPLGKGTSFEYYPASDPDGDGLSIDGGSAGSGYPRRVTSSGQTFQISREYGYDQIGNIVSERSPSGEMTRYYVDALNETLAKKEDGLEAMFYSYDANGNLSGMRQGEREASIEYAALDMPSAVSRKESGKTWLVERYLYDVSGRIREIVMPGGNARAFEYDDLGRPACEIDGESSIYRVRTCVERDEHGDVIAVIDADDGRTTFERNGFGEVVGVVDRGNGRTKIERDASGRIAEVSFADSSDKVLSETRYSYDGLGRLSEIARILWGLDASRPERVVTKLTRDAAGLVTTIADANQGIWKIERREDGRVLYVEDPTGVRRVYERDAVGNAVREYTTPRGSDLDFESAFDGIERGYDGFGRIVSYRFGAERPWVLSYDTFGDLASRIDPGGRKTELVRDGLGRVVRELRSAGDVRSEISYGWTRDGRLASIVDKNGRSARYFYDELARPIAEEYFDGSHVLFSYDDRGGVVGVIGRDGTVLKIERDEMGRPVKRTATMRSEGLPQVQRFEYDGLGRLTSADGDVDVRIACDSLSRPVAESVDGRWLQRRYDKVGNVISLSFPDGAHLYQTFDAASRLTGVMGDDGRIASVDYDEAGRSRGVRYAKGFGIDYKRHRFGGIAKRTYSYLGERLSTFENYLGEDGLSSADVTDGRDMRSYERDPLGRLIRACDGDAHDRGTCKKEWVYNYSMGDFMAGREIRLEFDAGGRMKGDGRLTFDYDGFGRISRVYEGGRPVSEYSYDALGRLFKIKHEGDETRFTWDGQRLVAEDGEGGRRMFIYGADDATPIGYLGGDGYMLMAADRIGSLRSVFGRSGEEVYRCDYSPYGVEYACGESQVAFCFAGHICDAASRLVYMKNRFYSLDAAAFLTPDPLGFKAEQFSDDGLSLGIAVSFHDIQGSSSRAALPNRPMDVRADYAPYPFWDASFIGQSNYLSPEANLYRYAGADPATYVDPLGLSYLVFDRSDERMYLFDGQGRFVTEYLASNHAKRPSADPTVPAANGPFPEGDFTIGVPEFYSEEYREDFYRRFGLGDIVPGESRAPGRYWKKNPLDTPDYSMPFGRMRFRAGSNRSPIDRIAYERQLFLHGGRHDYRRGTLGCIRADDAELETLAANYIAFRRQGDPIEDLLVTE